MSFDCYQMSVWFRQKKKKNECMTLYFSYCYIENYKRLKIPKQAFIHIIIVWERRREECIYIDLTKIKKRKDSYAI